MAKKLRKASSSSKKSRKVVFIVIDGLADTPVNERTPLSEARKPNMDYFAKNGVCGLLDLVPKTLPVASHIANVSLLGYNPKKYYLKRGPLEVIGTDLPYAEGHLAIRCNFATVDEDLVVTDRRAGRNSFGLDEISRYVNENADTGTRFFFMRTYGHRAVLVIKMGLNDGITDSDPYKNGEKVKRISALANDALVSAKMVQDFVDKSHNVIEYHPINAKRIEKLIPPANYILTRDAGNKLPKLPNFVKRYKIRKAVCISENGVMKGTCMLAGFNAVTVREEEFDAVLDFVFDNIDSLLTEYDFVYAHIKGVDEAAHDGNFDEKKRRIEKVDKKLEELRDFKGILVVTCDHITSCEQKDHVHGSVPVVVYGRGKDKVKHFDEMSAKKGKLKNYTGKKLMDFIFGR